MAKGFRAFDVYGEIHLDKDELRRELRKLPADAGADADQVGRGIGDKVGRGLAASVESWSGRIAKARRQEQIAAQNVTLAEKRLAEAREKGNVQGSRLLALEQRLERANWKLADANTAVTTATNKHADAQRRLAQSLTQVTKDAGPEAERGGRGLGERIFAGLHVELIRRRPVIAAAVAGGVMVGAPLVLTAATGMFAGIGIVAAAQSDRVRSAWLGTWNTIRDGAIDDARVIEPVLVKLADRVGDSFERMRPRLRGIFSDAAPQIEVFAGGLLGLTENALPGFERAVERGMPVTRGFADFLEKTGDGLTGFLDRMSSRAPAAGQAFSQLGDTMDTLLPLLGELLGPGAELATRVLPALNGSLGLVLGVATALGPVLPPIVAGFAGLKVGQLVGGWMTSASVGLGKVATSGGLAAGAAGKASSALGRMGRALPVIGVAVVGLSEAFGAAAEKQDEMAAGFGEWYAAVRQGGAAAEEAQAKIDLLNQKLADYKPEWGGVDVSEAFRKAADEAANYERNLTPIEKAQQRLQAATRTLSEVTGDSSSTTAEVAAAQREYKAAVAENERANADLEKAISGVTEAMLAQTDQALASIDSGFAYRQAQLDTRDAIRSHNDVLKDNKATADDVAQSALDVEQALFREAQAAAQAAADVSGLEAGTAEYDRRVQTETIKNLEALRQKFPEFTPVIDGMIGKLRDVETQLKDVGEQEPTPKLDLDDRGFMGRFSSAMSNIFNLGGQRPTPVANLNAGPFASGASYVGGVMGWMNRLRASPWATLLANTWGAEAAINWAARNRTAYITVFQRLGNSLPRVGGIWATGGKPGATGRGFAEGGTPRRRSDGKLFGPGGPFDDMIPAVAASGEPIRVSPQEWVINAVASNRQGDAKMAALNAGRADIVLREPPRRFAEGGRPTERQLVTQREDGVTVHVGVLQVKVETPLNLMNDRDLDRAAQAIERKLIEIGRRRG